MTEVAGLPEIVGAWFAAAPIFRVAAAANDAFACLAAPAGSAGERYCGVFAAAPLQSAGEQRKKQARSASVVSEVHVASM